MIELQQVQMAYGPLTILDGFSHTFTSGSVSAVTGPSGIGKTTLLHVIAGLLPITAGQVVMDGQVTDTSTHSLHPSRRNLGYVFQFPALWPHFTVRQNILYGLGRESRPVQEERLAAVLSEMGIEDLQNRRPSELSGGQARRVSLARTLITRPRYLLLDEPLNNLDAGLKDQICQVIARYIKEQQVTAIFVTHEPQEMAGLANQVLTFHSKGLD